MGATVPSEAIEAFRAYKQNLAWAKSHRDDLEPYTGRFAAVAEGRFLEAADSAAPLEAKYRGTPGVYITAVARRGTRWIF
jgi:hypothetical protein